MKLPDARGRFFLAHFSLVGLLTFLTLQGPGGTNLIWLAAPVTAAVLTLPLNIPALLLLLFVIDDYFVTHAAQPWQILTLTALYAATLALNSYLWALLSIRPHAERGILPTKKSDPQPGAAS